MQAQKFRIHLKPHKYQEDFLKKGKKYYSFISGIGAGKTVAGLMRVMRNAFEWNVGEVGYIVSPTYPMLRNVIIPEMDKWGIFDIPGVEYHRSEHRLDLPNGSKIIMESADNDRKIERLRGPSIAWFWLDEAATMPEMVWKIMIGRLRTGNYRNGFVTTTPKGFNWVHERFWKSEDAETIYGVPSQMNPYLPKDYFEAISEYKGQFYEQEVLGKFVKFEGLVYPWFDPKTHVIAELPANFERIVYGVDWGFRGPGCILALGEREGKVYVLQEFYQRGCTVADMLASARDMQQRWGVGIFFCDPSEPSNIEEFRRGGINAQKADNSILPGIQKVTSLKDNLLVSERCQNLINEFQMYRYDENDKETPLKINDHAADAMRYACMGMGKGAEYKIIGELGDYDF